MCNSFASILFFFLVFCNTLYSQKQQLIIGRTTGTLAISTKKNIRLFGFTKALASPVTLPGAIINAKVGDTIAIDFWNISQGNPVSLFCKEIPFVQKDSSNNIVNIKEPIHHMEHGYYSFVANTPGTFLYYSPENYPFNLQAGMFGIIQIEPKEQVKPKANSDTAILWCSHEIDTQWHTDALMGTEYDPNNKPIVIPKYAPNFFGINGQSFATIKGLVSKNRAGSIITLRLVNAGLYTHIVQFSDNVILELLHNKSHIINSIENKKVVLTKGESIDMLLTIPKTSLNETISYQFIDPSNSKVKYVKTLPIFSPMQ